MEKKFVSYLRVSTKKQKINGLGIQSQRDAVLRFINGNGSKIISEFVEQESGAKSNRLELQKAMALCRKEGSTLIIARLDRLSRSVSFIAKLIDGGTPFTCADMPEANETTLHLLSALAESEHKRIRRNVKNALDAKRKREPDWKPGTPANLTDKDRIKGVETLKRNANENMRNRKAAMLIISMRKNLMKWIEITRALNNEGFETRQGNKFHSGQVKRLYDRFINKI